MAYALVLLTTLYALALNNITFNTDDGYRSIVIRAVSGAAGALLATVLLWRRASGAARVMLALCSLANVWTLLDAGGRRLPSVMGWS